MSDGNGHVIPGDTGLSKLIGLLILDPLVGGINPWPISGSMKGNTGGVPPLLAI